MERLIRYEKRKKMELSGEKANGFWKRERKKETEKMVVRGGRNRGCIGN